jgi:AcrR family transcriptional regulator
VQTESTKEDLRVRRTRKRIQEALIELTVEKGYNRITVQDIVECAAINRSTFYRHYLDKDDLLSKYMDEVTGEIFQDDVGDEPDAQDESAPSGVIKLLNHIGSFSEFYRIMLSADGHPLVSDRLRRKIESHIRLIIIKDAAQDMKSPFVEMQLKYVSGAGIGAILWWVENNLPCSAEELAVWLSELTTASLSFSLRRVDYPVKA